MDMVVNERAPGVTCIRLNGRLDAPGADRIDLRFTVHAAAGTHHTLVDLTGVSFIASMGLRLLVSAARGLTVKGRQMVLVGASGQVLEVLKQTAIDQIIPMFGDETQALGHLRG